MDDERLIELVRVREHLYSLQHPSYMDAKLKSHAWKEIGQELDQPATACKNRWTNIRDQFRKSLARCNATRSGQAATKSKPYKYAQQLQFLIGFFEEREMVATTSFSTSVETDIAGGEGSSSQTYLFEDTFIGEVVPPNPKRRRTETSATVTNQIENCTQAVRELVAARERIAAEDRAAAEKQAAENASVPVGDVIPFFDFVKQSALLLPRPQQLALLQKVMEYLLHLHRI